MAEEEPRLGTAAAVMPLSTLVLPLQAVLCIAFPLSLALARASALGLLQALVPLLDVEEVGRSCQHAGRHMLGECPLLSVARALSVQAAVALHHKLACHQACGPLVMAMEPQELDALGRIAH